MTSPGIRLRLHILMMKMVALVAKKRRLGHFDDDSPLTEGEERGTMVEKSDDD